MARSTTLMIRILADATQAAATMKTAGSRLSGGLRKAMLPAAAVGAGLVMMGKSAAEDAQGQALLANSLKKTTGATQQQVAGVEDWISKTAMATGVADDQLRPAMATLARSTGDVATAQQAMGVSLDVAAATGKDAETVASAMAKAYAGNTTALGRMVPGLNKAVLKGGDMTAIMAELSRVTGGSAAVAADTAAGKWKRTMLAFDETKESIGAALLPAMDKLGGMMVQFGQWAARNTGTIQTLALVIGGLAAAVLAINGAMKVYQATMAVVRAATIAWTAVQWLLNAAMAANPITLIIIAVVALVAAIVIAYKKSATFRAIVQGAFKAIGAAAVAVKNAIVRAWNAVKSGLTSVWNWIKANVLAPLVAYFRMCAAVARTVVAAIVRAWQGLKAGLKAVVDWIRTHVIGPLKSLFDGIVAVVQKVIDWIGRIKIPGPVQKLIDLGKGVFGRSMMVGVPVGPAPTVGRGRGRSVNVPVAAAGRDRDTALVVNVVLDGKRVGGYVDRVITRRLNIEGARAAAGSWA